MSSQSLSGLSRRSLELTRPSSLVFAQAALQKAHAKSVAPDISLLIERNQVLEELVVANAKLKKEVAQYEGMPSVSHILTPLERAALQSTDLIRSDY